MRFIPAKGKNGFNFGQPYPPSFGSLTGFPHLGIDILCPVGTDILSPVLGEVLEARPATDDNAGGNMLVLRDSEGLIHRLMHNSKFLVKKGQRVVPGERIAISGNTGTSTAPHCHWDISKVYPVNPKTFKNFIDPNKWLKDEDMDKKELVKALGRAIGVNYIDSDPAFQSHVANPNFDSLLSGFIAAIEEKAAHEPKEIISVDGVNYKRI